MDRKLTSDEIFEKEFSTGFRGYNTEEVNDFLDIIIEDYNTFEKVIANLQEENRRLKAEAKSVPKRSAVQSSTGVATTPVAPPAPPRTNTTNFDILKRLSNLEKHVFGDKLSD